MRRMLHLILIAALCAAFIVTALPVQRVKAQTAATHVVQPGENLYRIALRYGVSVQAIAQANGIANP
ncbi:MAG TPA: LysM domain-containing protein, partial [Aggregatilineales bacterium]|nr:LysM domain-containing protein [Aggregatilineales bacterium]